MKSALRGAFKIKPIEKKSGFTIAELLLATSVFSVTLLVALAAFLGIGHLFYKGVSNSQNNEVARQVLNEISADIQTSPSVSAAGGDPSQEGYVYYCLGNTRYTYGRIKLPDNPKATPLMVVDPNNPILDFTRDDVSFGLLKDQLPGSNACGRPCVPGVTNGPSACNKDGVAFNSPQELLGNKMRVGEFSIKLPDQNDNPNLYTVDLKIAYGNDNVLTYDMADPDPGSTVQCISESSNQQYCAVTTLKTGVFKGVQT